MGVIWKRPRARFLRGARVSDARGAKATRVPPPPPPARPGLENRGARGRPAPHTGPGRETSTDDSADRAGPRFTHEARNRKRQKPVPGPRRAASMGRAERRLERAARRAIRWRFGATPTCPFPWNQTPVRGKPPRRGAHRRGRGKSGISASAPRQRAGPQPAGKSARPGLRKRLYDFFAPS